MSRTGSSASGERSGCAQRLGDRQGARANYARAIEILTPLAADTRAAHDAAYWLADVHRAAGGLAGSLGEQDNQRMHVDAAARLANSLVSARADIRARRLQAAVYFDQAMLLAPADRVDAWRRAAGAFERLLHEQPDDVGAQRSVALVAKYLGATHEARQEYRLALEQHQKALAIDEARLAAAPDDRIAMFDVAIDLGNVAFAHWRAGDLGAAAAGYEHSLALRQRLAERDPADVQAQSRVAFAEMRLALVYADLQRYDAALSHARRSIAATARLRDVDLTHQALHASTLEQFGRVQDQAGRRREACATYGQARDAVAAALGRGRDDTGLAETLAALETRLTACGAGAAR